MTDLATIITVDRVTAQGYREWVTPYMELLRSGQGRLLSLSVRTSIRPALYCNVWLYVAHVFGGVWERILLVHLHYQLLYSLSVASIYTIIR